MKSQLALGATVGLVLLIIILMTLHDWTVNLTVDQEVRHKAPLLIANGVTGKTYNDEGELEYRVRATKGKQFDHAGQLELTQPHIVVYTKDGRWVIDANMGNMAISGNARHKIVLTGDVKARQKGTRQPLKLTSNKLYYFPDTGLLKSPGEVTLQQQHNTTHAGSMTANIQKGHVEFNKGVESLYVVPTS